MRSAVADYRYRAYCLRIVPIYGSGAVVRLTPHPVDLTMSNGQVYKTFSGYDFTGTTAGTGSAASVVDIEGIFSAAGITRDGLASGVYDNARIYLFATTWSAPVEDEMPLELSFFGKSFTADDRVKIEAMSLQDVLGQSVGDTVSPVCTLDFGGQGFGGCGVDLGPLTVTGTLTSVTSASAFADSARAEAPDAYTAGLIEFTTGQNAGLKGQEIKAFASGGGFTLLEPFPYLPAVGDAYSLVPGCRKRLVDCQGYNNVARRRAFDHVPAGSTYTQTGGRN